MPLEEAMTQQRYATQRKPKTERPDHEHRQT